MRSTYVRSVKKWASRLHVHLPAPRAQDAVLLRAIAAGDTSVSYTHLDVYKRQPQL